MQKSNYLVIYIFDMVDQRYMIRMYYGDIDHQFCVTQIFEYCGLVCYFSYFCINALS